MPNWDDQFDFDDLDNDKTKAKPSNKAKDKKVTNEDDQFFDDLNSAPKKEVKSILPTINTRNSAKSNKPLVETPKLNPFANKSFGSKEAIQDDFEDDFEQEIEEEPKPKQQSTKISSKEIKPTSSVPSNNQSKSKNQLKEEEYDDEFYEQQLEEPFQKSVENKKNNNLSKNSEKHLPTQPSNTLTKNQDQRQSLSLYKPSSKPVEKQEDGDQYEEEFENDEYADDNFEQEVKSPVKKVSAKVNQLMQNIQSKSNPKLSIKTKENSKTMQPPQKYTSVKPNNNPGKAKQIQTRSQSVVPPKPPGNDKKTKQPAISSKNIHKPESQSLSKPMKRSASRQSIRSNGDKSIKGSRISQRNESQYFPNKHLGMVAKSFPHDEDKLNILSQLQINKINEKMRAMIRKFNEELNDLINKNMLLLKNKSLDKHLSLEERIKQLEIQKKSGETAIEVMEKDFEKLQGREGELREEEYQLILEKQIEEKKAQIKETTKQITVLKRDVDNKGKKLSAKEADQQNAQNIHHLKTNIIQARKEQQKGDQRIHKLASTFEELETKISDIDYKLDELISQAKEKGVTIENTDHMNKKYQELKTKLENIKNFNTKAQSLNSTKLEILNHENDQVRISIKNITSQISNLYGSIDHSQTEAIKLIEKAKEKVGINPLFSESLEKLLKQLEESRSNNDHDYFDARSEIKSRRSDSTKIKAQKNEDIEKSMPLRVTQSQNRLLQNEDTAVKPKFLKKKPEQAKLDIENKSKVNERVWNHESQSQKPSVNDENKHKVVSPTQQGKPHIDDKHEVAKEISQEEKKDKSKPFMLKKNKLSEGKVDELKQKSPAFVIEEKANIQLSLPMNPPKNEEKQDTININLAPRMMKFGKKRNTEDTTSQNNFSLNDNPSPKDNSSKPIQFSLEKKDNGAKLSLNLGSDKNDGLRLEIGEVPKKVEDQDKPVFVPKRFNLRGKIEKKEDQYVPAPVKKDNSYTSSIEINENLDKSSGLQKEEKKEEYQPKLNFLNDEPAKNPFKKETDQPVEPQLQIKPRFNLRLRDKASTNQDSYEPSKVNGPQLNSNTNIQLSNGTNQLNIQTQSKPIQNDFMAPKQNIIKANDTQASKNNPYNPYAPKVEPQVGIKLNVEPKKEEISISQPENLNTNNPYAAKFQVGSQETNLTEPPKRQRGPLRKNKISSNMPKQSFNIYAQADDITNQVKEIGAKPTNQNVYNPASNNTVLNNPTSSKQSQKLNINDMLGIKKEVKKNDFDDLLGDVGVTNAKNKKKNNDFFNDLQF